MMKYILDIFVLFFNLPKFKSFIKKDKERTMLEFVQGAFLSRPVRFRLPLAEYFKLPYYYFD